MVGEVKVLVVDDSAVMRRIITDIVQSEGDMTAIGAFPPYAPYNGMGIYARRAAE